MAPRSVAVVGGGPTGLIAAERLAEAKHKVTVYDARRSVGRKFLLAGRSGLNLTNAEPPSELIDRYEPSDAKLAAALRSFDASALQSWSDSLAQPTFVGSSGRVFPTAMRATGLLRAWLARLDGLGVRFATEHRWAGWDEVGDLRFETEAGGASVHADAVVFALGGASWPRVGSDGSWVANFRAAGIEVVDLVASNCGLHTEWSQVLLRAFEGEPLKNVACRVGQGRWVRGDIVITATGLEGGPIYAVGPAIRAQLETGTGRLTVDTAPDLTHAALTERLSNRRPKSSATSWLRSAGIANVVVAVARDVTGNNLPQDPAAMAGLLKKLELDVPRLAAIERAISTAGGVPLSELDERFMLNQRPGTFVAGEMLDWDAPTGGYLLQGCFSTGVAAAAGVHGYLSGAAANDR